MVVSSILDFSPRNLGKWSKLTKFFFSRWVDETTKVEDVEDVMFVENVAHLKTSLWIYGFSRVFGTSTSYMTLRFVRPMWHRALCPKVATLEKKFYKFGWEAMHSKAPSRRLKAKMRKEKECCQCMLGIIKECFSSCGSTHILHPNC